MLFFLKSRLIHAICVELAAYCGEIIGACVYGKALPDLRAFHPIGLVATVVFSAMTPYFLAILLSLFVFSIFFVWNRWPLWLCIIIFLGFAVLGYFIRYAWKT